MSRFSYLLSNLIRMIPFSNGNTLLPITIPDCSSLGCYSITFRIWCVFKKDFFCKCSSFACNVFYSFVYIQLVRRITDTPLVLLHSLNKYLSV